MKWDSSCKSTSLSFQLTAASRLNAFCELYHIDRSVFVDRSIAVLTGETLEPVIASIRQRVYFGAEPLRPMYIAQLSVLYSLLKDISEQIGGLD